ncbi:ADP-ribosyltransferase [Massilia endophytica]|uniref:ADP-ribosyltransferase n=1 Tax=Massilia endophytica TaxID=2899220 RepID=UPI002DD65989|nr:ADP-ribosyltransferase [Massilia endophytica]
MDRVERFIDGGVLRYPAYMSAATDETSVMKHFTDHDSQGCAVLLRIACHAGAPAIDMEGNEAFGNQSEAEFLLPRDSACRIDGITDVNDGREMVQWIPPIYAGKYKRLRIYDTTLL